MAPKLCLDCSNPTTKGPRCPEHTRAFDRRRGTARERGYDSTYDRNREFVLSISKICWQCGGYATTAGHVIDRIHGGTNDISNLRPECAKCNYSRGAALSRGGRGAIPQE